MALSDLGLLSLMMRGRALEQGNRSFEQDTPDGRLVPFAEPGQVVEFPIVQGLHHYYLPRAA